MIDKLLYHTDVVLNQQVEQIVVPINRRAEII